jgi:hypothetical protein
MRKMPTFAILEKKLARTGRFGLSERMQAEDAALRRPPSLPLRHLALAARLPGRHPGPASEGVAEAADLGIAQQEGDLGLAEALVAQIGQRQLSPQGLDHGVEAGPERRRGGCEQGAVPKAYVHDSQRPHGVIERASSLGPVRT